MLNPSIKKNDAKARWIIGILAVIIFGVVTVLGRYNLSGKVNLPFDEHIFAAIGATINTAVAVLLIAGLIMALRKKWISHRNIMITALILSVLFLLSYIAHHLFSGEAIYGDLNGDRILSPDEKLAAGPIRNLYLAILITHIPLAGIALPFIMFAAYRALSGDYEKHKKLVRFVWPAWFYVAVTGVIVYWMIRPYYH